MMHIYAFGSICRGDLSLESDVDLLALVNERDLRLDPDKFSIYSYRRMQELWIMGNAFAWHLALESKLIYSEDGKDFIRDLGMPSRYARVQEDCLRFRGIFESSFDTVKSGAPSLVFELSTIFLALRNLATCYSLERMSKPTFGRDSARQLGAKSLNISDEIYGLLMRSRLLSTRGVGDDINNLDLSELIPELQKCYAWVNQLCEEIAEHG